MEKGFVIWLTGFYCEGKGLLAKAVEEALLERGLKVELVNECMLREGFCENMQTTTIDAVSLDKKAAFIAGLLLRNGIVTVVELLSPDKLLRDSMRKQIRDFIEVYVRCPADLVGDKVANYEVPEKPEVIIDTQTEDAQVGTRKIIKTLEALHYVMVVDYNDYSDDEADEIKNRLESLGYL
ncbi:MAG: adenylyl-sulfate kinase [Candidatus Magnetoovum sp. WYHC-5]|nr:adenylyl-sulfate kinase [Candidatus Magnetoovum sp. WYHC-5]